MIIHNNSCNRKFVCLYQKAFVKSMQLRPSQHAYTFKANPLSAALHRAVSRVNGTMATGEFALALFLDIQGAFGPYPFLMRCGYHIC